MLRIYQLQALNCVQWSLPWLKGKELIWMLNALLKLQINSFSNTKACSEIVMRGHMLVVVELVIAANL